MNDKVFALTAALKCGVATLAFAVSGVAYAQTAEPVTEPGQAAEASDDMGDIVVTGSVIRGVAPTGSQLIGISAADVVATGATTSSQLLATIPQISNFFNSAPQIGAGFGAQQQVIRPNLRNINNDGTASGSSTLILLNGHRLVNVGVRQSSPDPEAIPPIVLDRVDIVTDGGSATYGADAVGGVINYVTKRRFDGVKVDASAGFADDYFQWDANVMAGKDWGSGSFYAAYSFTKHDDILGRDRDYVKGINFQTGLGNSTSCLVPTATAPGVFYPNYNYTAPGNQYRPSGAGLISGASYCDAEQDEALYPKERKHSVFASLTQELSDSIRFDVQAFYTTRRSEAVGGPVRANVAVDSGSAFYPTSGLAPGDDGQDLNVGFSFEPITGNAATTTINSFSEWGITPTLTADLSDNWQARAMLNYGRSTSRYNATAVNTDLLEVLANQPIAANGVNPFDIAATANRALIDQVLNYESAGEARDDIFNPRLIVDGTLVNLPGGAVKVAVGLEYLKETFDSRLGEGVIGFLNSQPRNRYSRDVKSAFGELQIPIFGPDNATGGFEALTLSAAGRYDSYSDFGSTFNPKFGLTWKPVDGVTLRGNWGKSFNAPTPVDQLGSLASTVTVRTDQFFVPPAGTVANPDGSIQAPQNGGAYSVVLQGSRTNLQPQKATTWSVGIDLAPSFAPGLTASVNYYSVDFNGLLGKAPVFDLPTFYNYYSDYYTLGTAQNAITAAQLQALQLQVANPDALNTVIANLGSTPVFHIIDYRTDNQGQVKVRGLDFLVNYRQEVGFGSIDARVNGNITLSRQLQPVAGAPWIDDQARGKSTFSLSGTVGANIGNLRAQVTVNHNGGYAIVPTNVGQTRIGSFTLTNLFFKYDFQGSGLTEDLSLTLNVNNVFDTDPPLNTNTSDYANQKGFANGFTLGRLFQVGFSKKF